MLKNKARVGGCTSPPARGSPQAPPHRHQPCARGAVPPRPLRKRGVGACADNALKQDGGAQPPDAVARACGPRRLQRRVRARGGHVPAPGRSRGGGGRAHAVRGKSPRGTGVGRPVAAAGQEAGSLLAKIGTGSRHRGSPGAAEASAPGSGRCRSPHCTGRSPVGSAGDDPRTCPEQQRPYATLQKPNTANPAYSRRTGKAEPNREGGAGCRSVCTKAPSGDPRA